MRQSRTTEMNGGHFENLTNPQTGNHFTEGNFLEIQEVSLFNSALK
jgi:hypothetical protein